MTAPTTKDLKHQTALLQTPLGEEGSGYTRYAAAMWHYKQGLMDAEELETYRICCKFDNENPATVYPEQSAKR